MKDVSQILNIFIIVFRQIVLKTNLFRKIFQPETKLPDQLLKEKISISEGNDLFWRGDCNGIESGYKASSLHNVLSIGGECYDERILL